MVPFEELRAKVAFAKENGISHIIEVRSAEGQASLLEAHNDTALSDHDFLNNVTARLNAQDSKVIAIFPLSLNRG